MEKSALNTIKNIILSFSRRLRHTNTKYYLLNSANNNTLVGNNRN